MVPIRLSNKNPTFLRALNYTYHLRENHRTAPPPTTHFARTNGRTDVPTNSKHAGGMASGLVCGTSWFAICLGKSFALLHSDVLRSAALPSAGTLGMDWMKCSGSTTTTKKFCWMCRTDRRLNGLITMMGVLILKQGCNQNRMKDLNIYLRVI